MDYHKTLVCFSEAERQLMALFRTLEMHETQRDITTGEEKDAYSILCKTTTYKINGMINHLKAHLDVLQHKLIKQST
jgi:hypothetical protein